MNNYLIVLDKLIEQMGVFIQKAPKSRKDKALKILNFLQGCKQYSWLNFNDSLHPMVLLNTDILFADVLAIQIILTDINELHQVLLYHKTTFTRNTLNLKLSFDEFFFKHGIASLNQSFNLLEISKDNRVAIIHEIEIFFRLPSSEDCKEIYFEISEMKMQQLISKVKQYVHAEDHQLLKDYFSTNLPKHRVRFLIGAALIIDLFKRIKENDGFDEKCSIRDICNWLSNRSFFPNRNGKGFTVLTNEAIRKFTKEKFRPENSTVRILMETFPPIC